MDDSVIKVLRRNGSWTNSKNVLSNEINLTKKIKFLEMIY